jgi:hypothetical protein
MLNFKLAILALATFSIGPVYGQSPQPADAPQRIAATMGINLDELNQSLLETVGRKQQGSLQINSYRRVSENYRRSIDTGFIRFLNNLQPLTQQIARFVSELNAVKRADLTPEQRGVAYGQLALKRDRLQAEWLPFYRNQLRLLFDSILDGYPFSFAYQKIKMPRQMGMYYNPLAFLFDRHVVALRAANGKGIHSFQIDGDDVDSVKQGVRIWPSPSGASVDYHFRDSTHIVGGAWTGWNDGYGQKCSKTGFQDGREVSCELGDLVFNMTAEYPSSLIDGISPSDPLLLFLFVFNEYRDDNSFNFQVFFDQAYAPILKKGCASEFCVQFHALDVLKVTEEMIQKLGALTVPLDVPANAQSILRPSIVLDATSSLPRMLSMRIIQTYERAHPMFNNLQD